MAEGYAFIELRKMLADLYDDEASARRIAHDAKLDVGQISFSTRSLDNWHNILLRTEKENKTTDLMGITLREFPKNENLFKAWHDYLISLKKQAENILPAYPPPSSERRVRLIIYITSVIILLVLGIVFFDPLKRVIFSPSPAAAPDTPTTENSETPNNVLDPSGTPSTPTVPSSPSAVITTADTLAALALQTNTTGPPMDTHILPTDTSAPPTDAPEPSATNTTVPPTNTPVPRTDTPTATPTNTPIPPTDTPTAAQTNTSLIAHWQFDCGKGGTDSSGNFLNGELRDDISVVRSDTSENCFLNFTGESGLFVANQNEIFAPDRGQIEVWFRVSTLQNADLISGSTSLFGIRICENGNVIGQIKNSSSATPWSVVKSAAPVIETDKWHYVVISWSESLDLFFDGEQLDSTGPLDPPGLIDSISYFSAGGASAGECGGEFIGQIDEITFYEGITSNDVIRANYESFNP